MKRVCAREPGSCSNQLAAGRAKAEATAAHKVGLKLVFAECKRGT